MERTALKITVFTGGCISVIIVSMIITSLLSVHISEIHPSISEIPLYGQYDSNNDAGSINER